MITKPLPLPTHDDNNDLWSEEVMPIPTVTLREYYAGWAMQGLLSNKAVEEYRQQLDEQNVPEKRQAKALALTAIVHADALIAALQEDNDE